MEEIRLKSDSDFEVELKPSLLVEGRRITLTDRLLIGSGDDTDLRLTPRFAADHHAVIDSDDQGLYLKDLSGIGVLVNEEVVQGTRERLAGGDRISIGGVRMFVTDGTEGTLPTLDSNSQDCLSIGSSPDCDVVLAHPAVSPLAAVIERRSGGYFIRDHSPRSNLRVNGQPTSLGPLGVADEIGIGPFRLVFDGSSVIKRASLGATLEAIDLMKEVGGKRILQPTTLSIRPGELVAIIGMSGAGKSTLLRLLAGADRQEHGLITLGGEPLLLRTNEIGFVPQDEIVHRQLTVEEALAYAALLRLPQGTPQDQIEASIWAILEDLDLEQHLETRVGNLSGGQRKRLGLAAELVHRPATLLLDEPTSGLDPALERRTMELFRRLAKNDRSVVVVTHSTASLDMVDKLLVMGTGGYTTYFGPPDEALEFFGSVSFNGIFNSLHAKSAKAWSDDFEASEERDRQVRAARLLAQASGVATATAERRLTFFREVLLLTTRYLKVFARDRRNLFLLLAQAPLLGLFATVVFEGFELTNSGPPTPSDVANSVFILVTISIWLGSIAAVREISKERAQLSREAAIGVRVLSYLTSKVIVLWGVTTVLITIMAVTALTIVPLDPGRLGVGVLPSQIEMTVGLIVCLLLAGYASVTLGLAVSAFARTQAQANSLLPLILIPQLLFGGAIVGLRGADIALEALASLTIARWGFAASGTSVDMSARISEAGVESSQHWGEFSGITGSSFFDLGIGGLAVIMAGFSIVFLTLAYLSIKFRQEGGYQPVGNE